MKNLLKAAALALLVAGSATAASAQAVYGVPGVDIGYPPYPAEQRVIRGPVLAAPPAYRVYENGKLIGQDPDPNVRMMLEKDFAFQ